MPPRNRKRPTYHCTGCKKVCRVWHDASHCCGQPAIAGKPLTREQQALVADNGGLIGMVMRRYAWMLTPDRAQAMAEWLQLGLVRAAQLYDPNKGFAFSTYASNCIQMQAFSWFRDQKKELILSSLEEVGSPDSFDGRGMEIESDDGEADAADRLHVRDLFERCRRACADERTWSVLVLRYCDGLTLTEIGDRLGVSKERARQIIRNGEQRLRNRLGSVEV